MLTKKLEYTSLIFISLLLFVWPLPNVAGVRNILLGLILLVCIFLFYKSNNEKINNMSQIKPIIITYALFLLWVVAGTLLFAIDSKESLSEIRGQLGFTTISIFIAYIIGSKGSVYLTPKVLVTTVFSILFLFVFYHDLTALKYYILKEQIPYRTYGLTVGLDELNYLIPFILSIFLVEFLFRLLKYKRMLPFDNFILSLMFLFTIASLIIQAKRNGIISISILLLSVAILYFLIHKKDFYRYYKRIIVVFIVFLTLIVTILYVNFQSDKRWSSLLETAQIVLTTDKLTGIFGNTEERPLLSNGRTVGSSNYYRLAYIKEGLILIKENPLGIGYDRRAFANGIKEKYSINGGTHAHCGFIDLGVGTGVIGLIIWTALIVSIVLTGFREFMNKQSYFGLLAAVLATSFYFRMFVDSINRDHMLQQFVFLISLYLVLMLQEKSGKIERS